MTSDSDIALSLLREQMTVAGPLEPSSKLQASIPRTTTALRAAWVDEYGRGDLPALHYFATMARALHKQFHITSKGA